MNTFSVDMTTATGGRLQLHVIAKSSIAAALTVLRTLTRPPRRFVVRASA